MEGFQPFGYKIAEISNPDKIFNLAVGLRHIWEGGRKKSSEIHT